jgi:hypothetical protein
MYVRDASHQGYSKEIFEDEMHSLACRHNVRLRVVSQLTDSIGKRRLPFSQALETSQHKYCFLIEVCIAHSIARKFTVREHILHAL